jgi:hypothetical protein
MIDLFKYSDCATGRLEVACLVEIPHDGDVQDGCHV